TGSGTVYKLAQKVRPRPDSPADLTCRWPYGPGRELGDLRRFSGGRLAAGEPVVVGDVAGGRGQDDRLLVAGELELGQGQAGQRAAELVHRHLPAADLPPPPGLADRTSGKAQQDGVLVRGQVH